MIPVVLKDINSGEMWFIRMPTAPIIGSVVSVSFPDNIVHKVVEAVHYECMGAEISKSEVKTNANEYPTPWNPNGYPECSVTVFVSNAVWNQTLQRWMPSQIKTP